MNSSNIGLRYRNQFSTVSAIAVKWKPGLSLVHKSSSQRSEAFSDVVPTAQTGLYAVCIHHTYHMLTNATATTSAQTVG